jgi:predicted type IV restriction endonuclease
VLTNGVIYWFYTDLEEPNKMDSKPFFEINMLDVREQDLEELKKFTKAIYNLDTILTTASELKYTRAIKQVMAAELQEPSEEFVKFFASRIYPGKVTAAIRAQLAQTTKRALRQFITDQLNERLKTALGTQTPLVNDPQAISVAAPPSEEDTGEAEKPTIVTTEEEHEGHLIIRAILREILDVQRVVIRDQQSYCGILLDNNNRRPIARLYFNGAKKNIGLFDGPERKEERVAIQSLDDLYNLSDRFKATVVNYLNTMAKG